jgi:hypothetical protein
MLRCELTVRETMPTNCTFGRFDDFALVVHNATAPTTAEWDALIEYYKSFQPQIKGILVTTQGGSPSAVQRKQLRELFDPEKTPLPPTAILTNSALARVTITAFNLYFNNKMKAIDPSFPAEALLYLKIPKPLYAAVLQKLGELALSIGVQPLPSYLPK